MQQPNAPDLRRQRDLAERHRVHGRVQWRAVLGDVQPRSEAMRRPAAADMRLDGQLGELDGVLEPSLCQWQLHGRLRAERDAVLREQRRNVFDERRVDQSDRVRLFGVRERFLHGCVHAGFHPVRRQRAPNVFFERPMERARGVRGVRVRDRRVHRRLHSRVHAVLG